MENWKITLPQAVPHEQHYWEPYFLLFSIFFHQQIKMVSIIQKANSFKAESDRFECFEWQYTFHSGLQTKLLLLGKRLLIS